MKNIPEIQSKLSKLRDSSQIRQLMDAVPEAMLLKNETKEILINALAIFIDKLIKHLGSKRPSKSSISNVVNLSFYKLQHASMNEEGLNCYLVIVAGIINNNFEGSFSNRLNVKSQEFLDLEDCEPF